MDEDSNIVFDNRTAAPKAISIIVATYNRPGPLAKCVARIAAALAGPVAGELIIVDDGSDADYGAVHDMLKARCPAIEALCVKRPHDGQASTKNYGAAQAMANIIAFVDDDVYVEPQWAAAAVRGIEAGADVVTGVVNSYKIPNDLFSDLVHLRHRQVSLRRSDRYGSVSNLGGIIAIKKDVFFRAGGYDSQAAGLGANMSTDIDLTWRLNRLGDVRMAANPGMVSWLRERNTLRSFVRQKYRSGYSLQFFMLLYQRDAMEVNQPQNRSAWALCGNLLGHLNFVRNMLYFRRHCATEGLLHALRLGMLLSVKRMAKDGGSLACIIKNSRKIKQLRYELPYAQNAARPGRGAG